MAAGNSSIPQFASLYVGDLHPDVTEAMLYEVFNSVGPVASIRVCRNSVTRRSLGYGYVNFHAVSDAERALDTLNYSSIKGRSCRIMWSQRDPSLRKSGAGNIYVKNLDRNIDNKALYDTFSLFGNILSCKVAADALGSSFGYGFVHYETEEAAKQAIERVNGMQIGEKTVQVTAFEKRDDRPKPHIENYTNLYIRNMPEDWDDAKLSEVFTEFGEITSSAMRADAQGRRFAFVNYKDTADAKKAVAALNQKDYRTPEQIEKAKEDGEKEEEGGEKEYLLYVGRAQTKQERMQELQSKKGVPEKKRDGVNLYVKNLDENCDDDKLRALFNPFGTIISVSASKDERARCKGFGFVCFQNPDEATKAVTEMHLKVVEGKPLYVGLAEKKEVRQERLRQRYTPTSGMGGKGKGGKGNDGGMMGGMGMPMGGMGGMGGMPMGGMPQMMGGMGMMPRPMQMGGMQGMPMGGKGMGGMGMPGMKGGPMGGGMGMPGQKGGGGMPGMKGGAMGMPGMMGGPMMGKGGPMSMPMSGPMMGGGPQMGGQRPPAMQGSPQPMSGGLGQPLNASVLAAAPPSVQKQMIGEKLFPAIAKIQPEVAGKITGMMLEMDNSELLILLESETQLRNKVNEAMGVLQSHK